jgi:hypothetical protein
MKASLSACRIDCGLYSIAPIMPHALASGKPPGRSGGNALSSESIFHKAE